MRGRRWIPLIILLLLGGLILWKMVGIPEEKNDSGYNISIIIRGKMDESWSNLKRGAESAADELNVNLRFVAAIEGNTAEEQTELLRQEAEGTDGIVISPVSRILMKDPIAEQVSKKKPIVLVESGLAGETIAPTIQCDNQELGRALAESVINHGNQKKKILIFSGNSICTSVVDRQKGFMKAMEKTKNECSIISSGSFTQEAIYEKLSEERPEVAVALDTRILENLVEAEKKYKKEDSNAKLEVYGAGCSSKILKALESKEIVSIGAEDDFSIGYLCVQEVVAAIEGKKVESNKQIRYIITNAEHMYSDENQRLLFPFVK